MTTKIKKEIKTKSHILTHVVRKSTWNVKLLLVSVLLVARCPIRVTGQAKCRRKKSSDYLDEMDSSTHIKIHFGVSLLKVLNL